MRGKYDVVKLFSNSKNQESYVKVCAPMVRYSKVQFRTLVKNYGVDMCFTPMILADSFCQNSKARASEFSTTENDYPLIAQFAANNINDLLDATKLIYPYVDGVDLNCGCPQSWAMKDGYGSALLSKPERMYDLIRGIRNNLPSDLSVSVKIRILKDLRKTIDMCKQLENCGATFLTVHGRTPNQKSTGEVNTDALEEVCSIVKVPIIANGGVKSLQDANELFKSVNCDGVMVASGILTNPALFSGTNMTPLSCIRLWIDLKNSALNQITFQCYHHHLVFMLDKILNKQEKTVFNSLSTFESVDEYLYANILNDTIPDVESNLIKMGNFVDCQYPEEITIKHSSKCRGCNKSAYYCICNKYNSSVTDGKFFMDYVKVADELDYMDSNMFDEPC